MPKLTEGGLSVEEMKQRIGNALGANLSPRWQVTGNGNVITVTDLWAENTFHLTIAKKDEQ